MHNFTGQTEKQKEKFKKEKKKRKSAKNAWSFAEAELRATECDKCSLLFERRESLLNCCTHMPAPKLCQLVKLTDSVQPLSELQLLKKCFISHSKKNEMPPYFLHYFCACDAAVHSTARELKMLAWHKKDLISKYCTSIWPHKFIFRHLKRAVKHLCRRQSVQYT